MSFCLTIDNVAWLSDEEWKLRFLDKTKTLTEISRIRRKPRLWATRQIGSAKKIGSGYVFKSRELQTWWKNGLCRFLLMMKMMMILTLMMILMIVAECWQWRQKRANNDRRRKRGIYAQSQCKNCQCLFWHLVQLEIAVPTVIVARRLLPCCHACNTCPNLQLIFDWIEYLLIEYQVLGSIL